MSAEVRRIVVPDDAEFAVSSDHHFNHKRIIEFSNRPFSSLWFMNDEMVRRHNAVVAHDDYFFALGDLALGDFEEALSFASRLNGIKYLKPGNHDRTSRAFNHGRDIDRYRHRYEDAGFVVLTDDPVEVAHRGVVFEISHYPYVGDHTEKDRHMALRPADRGLPLVHGHIHQTRRIENQMFNVGVDVNDFTPVTGAEVREFVQSWR